MIATLARSASEGNHRCGVNYLDFPRLRYGLVCAEESMTMSDLLFPTSVIGSLPRPQFVKDLIADDCPIQGDEYRRLMGNAIRAAVALQETAGLDVITDCEWWRKSYICVIAELANGFEPSINPAA